MEAMDVRFRVPGEERQVTVQVPSLDVARLIAGSAGFYDVDCEPMEPGKVKVSAYGRNKKLSTNGTTVHDACDKLIRLLVGEMTT